MLIKNEYPRPQFVRSQWINLNGEWDFAYDDSNCGLKDKWFTNKNIFAGKIIVPFVYQSNLSGIAAREPHDIVWYTRNFQTDQKEDELVLLHFGAVDYQAHIFLNGKLVKEHEGGNTPFEVDITPFLEEAGEQSLTVRAFDPHMDETIPRGKQFWEASSRGIWYTNSTGIWQTVWLEYVNIKHLQKASFTPMFDDGKVNITCSAYGVNNEDILTYEIFYKNNKIYKGEINFCKDKLSWDVDIIQEMIFRTNFHENGCSWTPETPNLFEVHFSIKDSLGKITDQIESYFGFRKIHTENGMVYLNNKPYYQKLVLDQGYWPDGLLTAPSDESLKQDIELAKQMGFNGCRKHQKTEDPRFLYWADKLGYLVWGECASAPMYNETAAGRLMKEWTEIIERDYNHPCIIVWVPLNESWGVPNIHGSKTQQHFSQAMYHFLHALDKTRLVISNDGWEMTKTDICAIHNYMHGQKQETKKYHDYKDALSTAETLINSPSTCWDIYAKGFSYQGEPILLTEFGGIGFDTSGEKGWGYTSVNNAEDFLEDYQRIINAVYASKGLWGYCYTQLTDVEQEINGILAYNRKPKCNLSKIKEMNDSYHISRI